MHKTATAALTIVVAILVVVLASLTPLSARALAEPAPTTAVCGSDADCMAYDQAHSGIAPTYDAQWNAYCPVGLVLYDTENPDMGDGGVICTLPMSEV